ncbi:MAG: serine hydrolase domain-containing protein [Egibacteraceae bacterium]
MVRRVRTGGVVLALVVAMVGGLAGTSGGSPPVPSAEAVGTLMDEMVPRQLAEHRIPGAAVVVVAGGEQVFARGYGLAHVDRERPVVADRTAFPVDSVAKLFTATAVMQLVERGRLDLHTDVNSYLPNFQIPDTYPGQPITLAHLLTHSAGFDERAFGLFSPAGDRRPALAEYVVDGLPARVRSPGSLPSYSNYSLALAGYLVEVASGMPFERYVQERLFRPLGMTRSTFDQPPPDEIAVELANGYRVEGPRQVVAPRLYLAASPAGSAVATVTDMGRFMVAHLRGDARMIGEGALAEMHRRQFGPDPRFPGMAIVFQERVRGGQRLLEHGGDGLGTHGLLALLPEHDAGVYVVYNGDGQPPGASIARDELVDRFVERFFPATGQSQPAPAFQADARRFAGSYRDTRSSHSDPLELLAVMVGSITVTAHGDGTLETAGLVSPAEPSKTVHRWVPTSPRLFQEEGGRRRVAFIEDDHERITGMVVSDYPFGAYEPVTWYQTPETLAVAAVVSMVLLLSGLFWRSGPRRRGARVARRAMTATAVLVLAFVAGLVLLIRDLPSLLDALLTGGSPLLNGVLALPLLAAVTTAAGLAVTVLAWRGRWWSLASRLHYTTAIVAAMALLSLADAYHIARWPA